MNDSFFLSPDVHAQVLDTIRKIENSVRNQAEIDRLWGEIKLIFSKELDKLPDIPTSFSKKPTKQFRKCKKFWNEELSTYWKDLCKYEKQYLNFKVRSPTDKAQKHETEGKKFSISSRSMRLKGRNSRSRLES